MTAKDSKRSSKRSVRRIDKHDVHAHFERAREALEHAEERAIKAMSGGWIFERREFARRAEGFLEMAYESLRTFEANLAHTLDEDEEAMQAETDALLGEDDAPLVLAEGEEELG